MDAQRALLDQLMGVDRNLGEGEELQEVDWSDPVFCSFFLSGLCPYMTFTGTKADIGKCTLKHDDNARKSFRRAKRYKQRKVDLELVDFIQKLLNDLDRHIRRGNDRIDTIASAPPESDREDVLNKVKEQIKDLHEEMETLAKEGQVEKSEKLLEQTKVLEKRRDRMVAAAENREDHRLLVCDICGGFQVQEDTNEERVDAHQNGKQHLGYIEVRKTLREIQDRLDKDDFEDRYGADGMVPPSAPKSRDRSDSHRKSSGRDRSGSRSRRRSSRDRHRRRSSRHDDDESDDHRSSRHRSSRSSRHRSSRHRSRSRDRKSDRSSRSRRSRSRDRRRHRSRSRDGDRHRSSRHRSSRGDRRSSSRNSEDDDKERRRRKDDDDDDESVKAEKSDSEKEEKDSDVDMKSEKSS